MRDNGALPLITRQLSCENAGRGGADSRALSPRAHFQAGERVLRLLRGSPSQPGPRASDRTQSDQHFLTGPGLLVPRAAARLPPQRTCPPCRGWPGQSQTIVEELLMKASLSRADTRLPARDDRHGRDLPGGCGHHRAVRPRRDRLASEGRKRRTRERLGHGVAPAPQQALAEARRYLQEKPDHSRVGELAGLDEAVRVTQQALTWNSRGWPLNVVHMADATRRLGARGRGCRIGSPNGCQRPPLPSPPQSHRAS
jgi:hypothetical protein